MKIINLQKQEINTRVRIMATVVWEDCDRDSQEVFYETTDEFAPDLSCDPHSFLVGCLFPAIYHGEQRIILDEPICPELHNGLMTAMAWYRQWGLLGQPIQVEASSSVRYPQAIAPRAGAFLSGGVDSLAILRANRLDFPHDHPNSVKDSIFVHGFDIGGLADNSDEASQLELALKAVSSIAQDAHSTLIPVSTNVRHLADDIPFWIYQFHGAALASVGHALAGRLTSVSIASGFRIANLGPGGTHPLIDPNYGSANLRIRHEGILHSRLAKVDLISDWQAALDNLRVCTMNEPGTLNCGRCEKCLRTMLELLASGSLHKTTAFPRRNVYSHMLENIHFTEKYHDMWYADLIPPLKAQGRMDLVELIERKRHEFHKRLMWQEERDWKGTVKRFDRRWLAGGLYNIYRTMRTARQFWPSQHT